MSVQGLLQAAIQTVRQGDKIGVVEECRKVAGGGELELGDHVSGLGRCDEGDRLTGGNRLNGRGDWTSLGELSGQQQRSVAGGGWRMLRLRGWRQMRGGGKAGSGRDWQFVCGLLSGAGWISRLVHRALNHGPPGRVRFWRGFPPMPRRVDDYVTPLLSQARAQLSFPL
jgi:hypothetical protein